MHENDTIQDAMKYEIERGQVGYHKDIGFAFVIICYSIFRQQSSGLDLRVWD